MKSYTDLEQSKKLATILPLESADMYWKNGVSDKYIQCFTPFVTDDYRSNVDYDYDIPCWSFAALFGVMPQYGYRDDKLFQFEPKICKTWEHSFIPRYKVTYSYELSTDIYDNPVDACVAMIEKLHELKML